MHTADLKQFAEHLSIGLLERGHEVFVYNSSLHPYKDKEWKNVKIIHCRDLENKIGTAGQFVYDLNCIRDHEKEILIFFCILDIQAIPFGTGCGPEKQSIL